MLVKMRKTQSLCNLKDILSVQEIANRNQLYVEEMLWVCCHDSTVDNPPATADSEKSTSSSTSHRYDKDLNLVSLDQGLHELTNSLGHFGVCAVP